MAAPEPGPARTPIAARSAARRWSRRRVVLGTLAVLWLALAIWHTHKPLLPGVNVAGEAVSTPVTSLQFIADVTAQDAQGQRVQRHGIHDATLELVRGARDFLLLDYFLFNDQGGPAGALRYENGLRPVAAELAAAVRELKQAQPSLPVLVITDPINGYYRGAPPPALAGLAPLGVEVVVTRLDGLRDSNFIYSASWRLLFGWWLPADRGGELPNVLDGAGPKLPLGALLRLPNFKANHRKLALTGDGNGSLVGIVASANPHDASSAHSNVALRIEGEALRPLLESELAVARFSGWEGGALEAAAAGHVQGTASTGEAAMTTTPDDTRAAILTEGAIRDALLARLAATAAGDAIDIAQFYLADRGVIGALLDAAQRGVAVRVLLDPNRDAFGFEKGGIPNRPVGNALRRQSGDAIALRWYRTHGEQFHVKLAAVRSNGRMWFTLGSANFTRRNIGNYNLEANAAVDTPADSALAAQVENWFEALWSNADGVLYSAPADAWVEDSALRRWRAWVMEASGLSTF